MTNNKWPLIAILLVLVVAFFAFDIDSYFTLDYFNQQKYRLFEYYQQHPLQTALVYFLIYVVVTGLSLPGAALMTLAGGAIFGFWTGLFLVSFASTIGASIAFLVARVLLRDWVQNRFGDRLGAINSGVEKDGAFYLFSIRLVPAFPFFLVNLLMGLTPIKLLTFFLVSQVGMLAGTMVYVNAGKQLAEVDSIGQVLSPALLSSFLLLAVFPFIVRKIMDIISARRAMAAYKKPAKLDANVVVIGAGSAGLVSALIGTTVKAKAVLIESEKMGGDCLNTGCVPSKALLRSAKMRHYFERMDDYGLQHSGEVSIDFPAVMRRVQKIIGTIEPHDSVERFESLGVECVQGQARIVSPYEVQVGDRVITTGNIIIASGARPFVPPIKGIDQISYLTSDNIWQLEALPEQLLILGAGPIGCELAQAFARLGSKVTLLDMEPRILPREDEDAAAQVASQLEADGINIVLNARAQAAEEGALVVQQNDAEKRIAFEKILVAVGRRANTEGLGLEELGLELNRNGTVMVDDYLRTRMPNIYACGDVAGPYQFTHTASHQAWFATVNALFGIVKKFKVDYSVIPWATFTDPEVARVGLNEMDAQEKNIAYEVTRYGIDDLDRAIADSEAHGFVKVLTPPGGSDKILGVTIVGYHASELISEFVLAMKHGLGLKKIMGTIHIYPTLAEANKFAASEWQKKHAPQGLLQWVEKFHAWRRG
ncbi:MAG: dihydrolipoyl dehydrogenase [Pseudomonadales bacterium]